MPSQERTAEGRKKFYTLVPSLALFLSAFSTRGLHFRFALDPANYAATLAFSQTLFLFYKTFPFSPFLSAMPESLPVKIHPDSS